MTRKASVSHDEAMVRRLRRDPEFAAEYLRAALEDEDEPRGRNETRNRFPRQQGNLQ
jgi:DNA-binding phage protein